MATKKQAVVTIGIPASGKTTWAIEEIEKKRIDGEKWAIVSRDDIRKDVLYKKKNDPVFSWDKWNWKWENTVTQIQNERFEEMYNDPRVSGIIVADTNVNFKTRTTVTEKLLSLGFEVQTKNFCVSFEEACRRDAQRSNGVGYSVIARQYKDWNLQFGIKQHIPNPTLPKAVIVDVDGTVAEMVGRSPFNWDAVDTDLPKQAVIDVVCGMSLQGYEIIFLSGRCASCYEKTKVWLEQHVGVFFRLYMRNEGDDRDDRIVKKELLENFVEQNYNISLIIDDRPKMCRMWEDMGIPILRVGNPYIEF